MKEKLLHFISYFHWYDIVLMSSFLMIALCFIFLSFIFFRRKIISIPMFLIGFLLIIALPFVTRYILEERFYKVQVDEIYNKVYNYSDVYQYIAEITNVGKRNIAGCVFSHQILYDTSKDSGFVKYKHMLLNYVKPRHIYNKDIPMQLDVGQSVKISQVMEDYPHRNEPFVTKIECYGKGKAEQNEKVLVGYKKPPTAENAESSESTESSAPENAESSASNTTQDSKDSNIPKEPFNAPSSNIESSTQDVETSTANPQDSNINANIESNLQNIESSAPNPSNVTPNTESNIESNTESNIESSTPSSPPPPQNPQNPPDSTPDNSIDLQNSQEAQEEAKREEERKRREERDNFNVPMLKEAPR